MKIRYVIVNVLLVAQAICHAEVTGPLSTLKNEWGKGCPMDFRKKVYETVPAVLKNGGDAEMIEWYQEIVSYPDLTDAMGATAWMHEKVETLLVYALRPPVSSSTNCWLAVAELLNRYRKMVREAESNANIKIDFSLAKTDPKRFDELFYDRKRLRKNAWNLKCVETQLARVVTNVFPEGVLPLLPESERDKMMSEVLERSGLKSANEDEGVSSVSRRSLLTVVSVIACSFALGGCILYRRFKRRNVCVCGGTGG